MDATQSNSSFDLFAYLHAPGATEGYKAILEKTATAISSADSNCFAVRAQAAFALVQIPIELVLATLIGAKNATVGAVCALLSFDGERAIELVKSGLLTVVHSVKLAIALPFLFLGAITGWPNQVIDGLLKANNVSTPLSMKDWFSQKLDDLQKTLVYQLTTSGSESGSSEVMVE